VNNERGLDALGDPAGAGDGPGVAEGFVAGAVRAVGALGGGELVHAEIPEVGDGLGEVGGFAQAAAFGGEEGVADEEALQNFAFFGGEASDAPEA